MISKKTKIKSSKNRVFEMFSNSENCKVSIASNEIMLDRFNNGKGIEFPFSKWLKRLKFHLNKSKY